MRYLPATTAPGMNRGRSPGGDVQLAPDETFVSVALAAAVGSTPGHADPQAVLRILNRRRDYDLMTLQEAIKSLGILRCEEAVAPIKDLFETPPREFHPMFRNHCLDAIASIQGSAACDYFKEVQRREKRDIVLKKLVDLIKKNCG